MSTKNINIEKFNITSFEKEHKPYTVIPTDVIQRSTNIQATYLWIFFQSLPDTWIPNKSHITQHFDISDRTYERWLSWLNASGLIEYRQDRKKDGSFGGWRLVILNGLQFNPDAESNRSAKIGGTVVNRKKSAQIVQLHRSANLPLNGEAVGTAFGGHINTTEISRKEISEKQKTNKASPVENPVLFSSKTFLLKTLENRALSLKDEIIEQILFYVGDEKDESKAKLKINAALKLAREGKWNIPHGFNGITQKPAISEQPHKKNEETELERMKRYEEEHKRWNPGLYD